MTEVPLLAAVTLALPSRLQAIGHIPHLINHFLIPATIDAAVYLELTRVSKVFRIFRPLTVGAMDGAASRGRLDILRRQHASSLEGCSAAAFNGAAANNHLQVLQWLFLWYEGSCNLKEAVVSAAAAGHLRIVRFLSTPNYQLGRVARLRPLEYEAVVEAAVINGQIEVLEYLLNVEGYRRRGIVSAVNAAAENGLTGVVQLLLRTCNVIWLDHFDFQFNYHGLQYAAAAGNSDIVALLLKHGVYNVVSVDASVEKAAEAGHMNVVFMLLSRCGESGVVQALKAAVANNRHTLAEFLIRLCSPWQVANVISTGNNDQRKLFELLLAKHQPLDCLGCSVDKRRYTSFVSAAAFGNEEGVREFMNQFSCDSTSIGYVVEVAAALSRNGVVKMILDEVASRNLHLPDFAGVKSALNRALKGNDLVMARLLTEYCDRYVVGTLLNKYATASQVEIVRVLAERSYQFDVAAAAFDVCMAGREDVSSVLMEFMQETTALEVSVKLATAGKVEFVKRELMNQQKLDQLFAEAVASGRTELVKHLLDEMSEQVIESALLTAVRFGHVEVVKLLLGKSASWDIQFYALEEAAKAGKANVVDFLRQWCGPARVSTIIADLRAAGEEEAAALLDTKRSRLK